jgi:uncharacterized protein DUF6527
LLVTKTGRAGAHDRGKDPADQGDHRFRHHQGAHHPRRAYKYFSDGTTIGPTGMTIICPCGCGAIQPLHFKPGPSPSWKWNAADAPAQRAPQGALAWLAAPQHLGEPLTLAARSGPTSRTAPRPDALPDHHGGPDRVQGETIWRTVSTCWAPLLGRNSPFSRAGTASRGTKSLRAQIQQRRKRRAGVIRAVPAHLVVFQGETPDFALQRHQELRPDHADRLVRFEHRNEPRTEVAEMFAVHTPDELKAVLDRIEANSRGKPIGEQMLADAHG